MEKLRSFFSFPETVNDVSARFVALGVLCISIFTTILISIENSFSLIMILLIGYGFLARVSSGPKISPLALLVTKVIVPNLNFKEKIIPGPPKRFAQGIGFAMSLCILLFYIFGFQYVSIGFLTALIAATSLESFFGYCVGCKIFKIMMGVGIIPKKVCERCADYEF